MQDRQSHAKRGTAWAAVLIALALVAAACSASADVASPQGAAADASPADEPPAGQASTVELRQAEDSPETATPESEQPDAATPATTTTSPLLDLLAVAPDDPISFVTLTDFDRVAEALGTSRPVDCSTNELRTGYREDLIEAGMRLGVRPPQLLLDVMREPEALAIEFGIEICEIAASLEADLPGEVVMLVDTDPVAIDTALRSDPVWSDLLNDDEFAGHEFYDWGDGIALDLAGPSPARRIAEAGQLAFVDGAVIRTRELARMQAYLAVSGNGMLERDNVRDVVERLVGKFGTYSITLTEQSYGPDVLDALGENVTAEQREAIRAELSEQLGGGLLRWDLLGLGGSLDAAGDPILLVVMAHGDAADAATNAVRFTEVVETGISFRSNAPWSELFVLEDVAVDGHYLTATLRSTDDGSALSRALSSLFAQDSLFMTQS